MEEKLLKKRNENAPRKRAKCSHACCDNNAKQGGGVTHEARQKSCNYPNWDKTAFLAGRCSAHGPSRRKAVGHCVPCDVPSSSLLSSSSYVDLVAARLDSAV